MAEAFQTYPDAIADPTSMIDTEAGCRIERLLVQFVDMAKTMKRP